MLFDKRLKRTLSLPNVRAAEVSASSQNALRSDVLSIATA